MKLQTEGKAYKCFTPITWVLVLCLENSVQPLSSFFSFFSSYFDIVAAVAVILCRITKRKFCWRAKRKYFFASKYQFNSLSSITLLSAFLLFSKPSLAPQINFQWWPSNKNVKMQWKKSILKKALKHKAKTHAIFTFVFSLIFHSFFHYCNKFIFIISSMGILTVNISLISWYFFHTS